MNIGAEDGFIPANVFESMRAMVTAGLANDVEEVNQYAPPIQAPTAKGTTELRPDRTIPWMRRRRPAVATASDSQRAPDERVLVERVIARRSNMRLAITAPTQPPKTWAPTKPTASRVGSLSRIRNERVTAGLKWAPEIGPNMRIRPMSAPAVAAAFSSSCKPTSLGERRCAMIPEPMTATMRRAVPSASAVSLRARFSRSSVMAQLLRRGE